MRPTLDTFSGGLMIAAAAATDLFQFVITFIPFAGSVLAKLASIAFGLIVFLWLLFGGELNLKTFLWLFGAGSLEFLPIPFLDMLPAWTGGVALLAGMIVLKHARQARAERAASRAEQLREQRAREEEYVREQEEQIALVQEEQMARAEEEATEEEYASREQAAGAYA
ncbi:MAG: hypothetical protein Q8R39_00050 [bacterium]|nr:hypothetical protein [bacterium]MDZ4284776.1 hypothetical protein [Patescibacteria group bacterium]